MTGLTNYVVIVITVPEHMATTLTPFGPFDWTTANELRDALAGELREASMAGNVTVHELYPKPELTEGWWR